jgi:hypothetical protein
VEAKELGKHAIDDIDGIIQKFTHTSECITLTTIPDSEQACLGIISMVRSMAIGFGYCLGQWGETVL